MAEPDNNGSLRDLAERVALALVGAASMTGERVERLAGDLTSINVGAEHVGVRLSGLFREVGLVTRDEWEELELRLAQVEHRLRLLEDRADPPAAP
jgi:polyhydroxyalkanoate synthesis regulator phasin